MDRTSPSHFDLENFRKNWPALDNFTHRELRAFLRLCSNTRSPESAAALDLLLDLPAADDIGYYLRLASSDFLARVQVSEIPLELLKIFCELFAFGCSRSPAPEIHRARKLDGPGERFFGRMISRAPRGLRPWLFGKRFPIRPFLDSFSPRRLFPDSGQGRNERRKWRIWRQRLAMSAADPADGWDPLQLTLADLRFLAESPATLGHARSAWKQARMLTASKDGAAPCRGSGPLGQVHWPEAGDFRLASFWNGLIEAQAGELESVSRLAQEVSRRTGSVVLSWHNATLAAAGGWGFGDLAHTFCSKTVYGDFLEAVLREASTIRKSIDLQKADDLFSLRAERLLRPKMSDALDREEIRLRILASGICGHGHPGGIDTPCRLHPDLEWSGALSPHQEVFPGQLPVVSSTERKAWVDGMALLLALAREGRKAIRSGAAQSLVLPWIDKFFISSRRRADGDYLMHLFEFISEYSEEPLVLFWEDTAHFRAPSFALALDDMVKGGAPFRGIGIFDPRGSDRREAERIVCTEYPGNSLFALRPVSDSHCADAFFRIFRRRDPSFFQLYDSSWKDNLAFLYTGTQVFPLVAVQTEMEPLTPWVYESRARCPFGAWFRRRLRSMVLPRRGSTDDSLWPSYATWANLL
ncbi:MAG: hypothetical protein LLG06_03720 [Desulfobacteraceae bacterium]|nr:hypothetical protein [Desulfobacteraceae bacterium]